MSTVTHTLEHAEHAAHGAHKDQDGNGKSIGLTMAILGVLLAFCAAEVGQQRTELTKSLVEQTQVSAESQANQMKYRLVMLELEKIRAGVAQPGDDSAKGEKGEAAALPDPVRARTLDRLLALAVQYIEWKDATKAWVKTFDPVIQAHAEAAVGFERSQLAAEVGIVVASIALLLSSRKFWFASLFMGVLSLGLIIQTYTHSSQAMTAGEHAIEASKEKYAHVRSTFDANEEDRRTLEILDPGGKRRSALLAAGKAHEVGDNKGEEHK
jgi:uncharacterized protein DUF4337